MTTYILGGGCFWCTDAVFRRLVGVSDVTCGYSGGRTKNPTYDDVITGTTGHTEVVSVTFDESIIPKEALLDIFFLIHDPTTKNRQGADIGTQYRSSMFYADPKQKTVFQQAIERAQHAWSDPIVTSLERYDTFYRAEDVHQNYFSKHPDAGYCTVVIEPKIVTARQTYSQWFKTDQ